MKEGLSGEAARSGCAQRYDKVRRLVEASYANPNGLVTENLAVLQAVESDVKYTVEGQGAAEGGAESDDELHD